VPVDVNVVDRTGRPIADLTAADFALKVDGRPRKIRSAQFIAVTRDVERAPVARADYSSNAASTGGRLIMLVIDQGNIGLSRGKYAIAAASRFVSRLSPADRVGLVTIPGAGPQIDFTSNHALIQNALQRIVGLSDQGERQVNEIGLSEALALERGNEQLIQTILDRECSGLSAGSDLRDCRDKLLAKARTLYVDVRGRTRDSLLSLRVVMDRRFGKDDEHPNRRVAEAVIPIALLPPGEYIARAVVSVGGQKLGQVSHPFRIVRAAGANPSAIIGALRTSEPIPFTSRIEAFERTSVLAPPVVGFFLDRMNVGRNAAMTPPAAIEAARAGRFDEAIDAVTKVPGNQLAPVFLRGLALYAKGDLEGAAGKFRESLRIDSEFFPAAFYLGACYAAGGHDREAAGAWQTSLITEGDAPFVYTLLGDAFLRLHEEDQAIDILKEASTLWPGRAEVQMRLGTAYAQANRPVEAIQTLDPYLTEHPQDQERLFVALRAIYEARSVGKAIGTAEEDRQRFDRYATAYAKAGGTQQALVDQWRKFISK
jgi:hypothetical protein